MFDENRAVRELTQLAQQARSLEAHEYERLAMAVLGELLARDARRAEDGFKRDNASIIARVSYGAGGRALSEGTSLSECWQRLRQDLYSGEREAFVGVQRAMMVARQMGLLTNPRWGGEKKREIETLCRARGWDPYARPGLRTEGPTGPSSAPAPYVAPDIRNSTMKDLPIAEQLGIADAWIAMSAEQRAHTNRALAPLTETQKVARLKTLAGTKLYERADNRDIPWSDRGWVRRFPPQLAEAVFKLPPRSQAILAARYQGLARSGGIDLLHKEVNNAMFESQGRLFGEDILRLVTRHLAHGRDSLGSVLGYEMRLEQGQMGFSTYLQLRDRHSSELAQQERAIAARHEQERQAERMAFRTGAAADQSMTATHRRLAAERWVDDPVIKAAVAAASGELQRLADGAGYAVYDEYYILVDEMPPGVTAEAFVLELASDLNKTVGDGMFSAINMFKRRAKGKPPAKGEIVDIDIGGPDNGSVMLTELTPTYFIYSCIKTSWGGYHPEYGSREFGVERMHDGRVKVYTRAVSAPGNAAIGWVGGKIQIADWSRLMRGISDTIQRRGGRPVPNSFKQTAWKVND